MFLSIIVPVYEVETYLKQCIESIIIKQLNDIEIILVDDGSTDLCPIICDKFSEKYSFIKVIHKKNNGLSSARNEGLKIAVGKYIMFLDSDDWWNPTVNMNKILEIVKKKSDVEMFLIASIDYIPGRGYYMRKKHKNLKKINTNNIELYYKDLLINGNLEVHAGTKILKRDFLNKNNLIFKTGIVSEDNEWFIRLLRCLNKVDIIDEPLYVYRVNRPGSITNNIKIKNVLDILGIVKSSLSYYKLNDNQPLKNYELCYCAYLWFIALGLSNQLCKQDKQKLKEIIKQTSHVCSYSNFPKTKLAYMLYRLCGTNITAIVLGKYITLNAKKNINKKRIRELL